jgi:hypothetical protein
LQRIINQKFKQIGIQEFEANKANGNSKKFKIKINYISTKNTSKWWKWAHP